MRHILKMFFAITTMIMLSTCQTGGAGGGGASGGGGDVKGNDAGSEPVNAKEASDYQNAVNRCHRTGGTRVVKIMGDLRCF